MLQNNKVMVYDDNCPLCNAYTSVFVKMGLLEANGRQAFSNASNAFMCKLNVHKSRNEIPLLDTATNQTWYGIDAMLEVINTKYPLVKKIANTTPLKWFLVRLYKLISYNRKVIVAVPKNNNVYDCTPDFNAKYRSVFLLLIMFISAIFIAPAYTFFNVQAITLQQTYVAFTVIVIVCFAVPKLFCSSVAFHYWGQMAMLVLLNILLCIPLLLTGKIVAVTAMQKGLYLLFMLAFISKEAWRRKQYLQSIIDCCKRPLSQLKQTKPNHQLP